MHVIHAQGTTTSTLDDMTAFGPPTICETCYGAGRVTAGTVDPNRDNLHITWIPCPDPECTAEPAHSSKAPWRGVDLPWRRFNDENDPESPIVDPSAAQHKACPKCKGAGYTWDWSTGKPVKVYCRCGDGRA